VSPLPSGLGRLVPRPDPTASWVPATVCWTCPALCFIRRMRNPEQVKEGVPEHRVDLLQPALT